MSDWPDSLKVGPIREWPGELTRERKFAPFKTAEFDSYRRRSTPLSSTLELLDRELRMLSAKNAEMLVAIAPSDFRLDGKPRAQAKATHPGVILSFDSKVGHLSYPCDTFTTWQDNLRAIAKALEALRMVDRYGVTKRGEQYRGFLAIEARATGAFTSDEAAMRYLAGVADMIVDPALEMVSAFDLGERRRIAARALFHSHPDRGGDRGVYEKAIAAQEHLRRSELL